MRVALLLPIALCCAAFALPANAVMKVNPPEVGVGRPIITIAHRCPLCMGWVPAGISVEGEMEGRSLQHLGAAADGLVQIRIRPRHAGQHPGADRRSLFRGLLL